MTNPSLRGAKDGTLRRPAIRREETVDKGLLTVFILLLAVGLLVLYAASYYNAQDSGNSLSEVLSQLMGVGVGAAARAVVLRVDYRVLARPWLGGGARQQPH